MSPDPQRGFLPSPAEHVSDDAANTGTIQGVITYSGDVPKSPVRDNAGQQRELLSVHRRSRGLRYALVYLEHDEAHRSDSEDSAGGKKAVESEPIHVDQVEQTFRPHLTAIRDGQQVKFTNSDAANHNVRAIGFEAKNQFNVMTSTSGGYIHQFVPEKKKRPILLICDLHPWMRGWIFVLNHPYFAVSNERGKFIIRSVPHGAYRLVIRQPDVGYRQTLAVDVKTQEITKIEIKIASEDLKNL